MTLGHIGMIRPPRPRVSAGSPPSSPHWSRHKSTIESLVDACLLECVSDSCIRCLPQFAFDLSFQAKRRQRIEGDSEWEACGNLRDRRLPPQRVVNRRRLKVVSRPMSSPRWFNGLCTTQLMGAGEPSGAEAVEPPGQAQWRGRCRLPFDFISRSQSPSRLLEAGPAGERPVGRFPPLLPTPPASRDCPRS